MSTNLQKTFNGKVHAPNGTGTDPLCTPYGGNGSHTYFPTAAEVTCRSCLKWTATTEPTPADSETHACEFCASTPPYTPGDKIPANACQKWAAENVDQRLNPDPDPEGHTR